MSANGTDRLLPPAGIVCKDYTAAPGEAAHEWIARQLTEAFPWDQAPRYIGIMAQTPQARSGVRAYLPSGVGDVR